MTTMILNLATELNEALLDEVARQRKLGNKTSKEKIIIKLIEQWKTYQQSV